MTTTKLASSFATALLTHGTYAVGDDRSTLDLSEYRDAASFLHGENSRNGFSESHFVEDSHRWLATFARDMTNSIGRPLLHFM